MTTETSDSISQIGAATAAPLCAKAPTVAPELLLHWQRQIWNAMAVIQCAAAAPGSIHPIDEGILRRRVDNLILKVDNIST
jgi:hypothetical protein